MREKGWRVAGYGLRAARITPLGRAPLRVTIVLVIVGLAAGAALALGGEAIERWVIAGGGGPSTGGNVAINDTLGQPIVGPSSLGTVGLGAGYWYGAPVPTAVEIVSFTAEPWDDVIVIRWETAMEVDLLGFNLYRADTPDGVRLQLNETLIPVQAPGSPIGAQYEWSDDNGLLEGQTYFYWLEAIDVHGSAEVLGPVDAMAGMWRLYLPLVTR